MTSAAERLAAAKQRRRSQARPPVVCRLRQRRDALGLSLRDMADEIGGISYAALQLWEKGRVSPNLENAYKIARFFGVPVTDLWPEPEAVKQKAK